MKNSQKYSKLLSEFEDMQGITSNNFDERDWNKFDRYVEGQLEEEKKDWIFERSSGYAGYRNTETNEWIYEREYLRRFNEREYSLEKAKEHALSYLKETREKYPKGGKISNETIDYIMGVSVEVGYKFAQKQLKTEEKFYTKEEVLEELNLLYSMKNSMVDTFTDKNDRITMKWFEQDRW